MYDLFVILCQWAITDTIYLHSQMLFEDVTPTDLNWKLYMQMRTEFVLRFTVVCIYAYEVVT